MSDATKTRSLFSRLRAREYLRGLMQQATAAMTTEKRERDRLQVYLLEWANQQHTGYNEKAEPDSVLAQYIKSGSPSASELFEESNGWAMAVVDASIDDLIDIKPDGWRMRAALRVRYLNEGLMPGEGFKIRVFRSGRTEGMSLEEADALADRAESALIPIVKRRGLPL